MYELLFLKGVLPTSLFILVMWAGALPTRSRLGRHLKLVRTEFSLMGCHLILAHMIPTGYRTLTQWPPDLNQRFLFWESACCLLLLLPLWITSYPVIRRKMTGIQWKKLQKLAYPLYGLIALHGFYLYGFILRNSAGVLAYILLFLPYPAARFLVAHQSKQKRVSS